MSRNPGRLRAFRPDMRRLLALIALLPLLPASAEAAPRHTAAPGRIAVTYDSKRMLREEFGALAAAPDGTVFAAGATGRGLPRRLAITAFDADGSFARGFGTGGGSIAPVDVHGGDVLLRAADGTLTAIGRLLPGDGSSLGPPGAVRVSANGAFDRSYGGDGVAEVPGISQIGCFGCRAAALAPDGGLLVAGHTARPRDDFRLAVARLRPDGSPDPAFGSGGVSRPLASPSGATTLLVQPSGRIVVSGSTGSALDPGGQRGVLVGLRPDGSLDPGFGDQGVVRLNANAGAVTQDASGRLLVAAFGPGVRDESAVRRFTADGMPDASWTATPLGRRFVRELLPAASGVTALVTGPNAVTQIRLDDAGGILSRRTTRIPFGGGRFFPARPRAIGRDAFTGQSIVARPDGSIALGGAIFLTREAEGDTVDRSEAGIAFVQANGALAPTIRTRRTAIRAAIRRDRLGAIRRRRALRIRFRPGARGLALVTARARGRTIARGNVPFWTSRPTTGRVRLTRAGRRLTGSARGLRVRVTVTRNDMAGNRSSATARATLRR
jgi:uncharacterized delta-60 repeat protein